MLHDDLSECLLYINRLDVGEGKDLDLPECPRAKLKKQCIKYLGPVRIFPQWVSIFIQNGELYDCLASYTHRIHLGFMKLFLLFYSKNILERLVRRCRVVTCGPVIVRKGEDVYTKFWTGGSGRPVRRTWRRAHRRSRVGQPSLGDQRQHGDARLLVGGEGGRPLWGEGGREGGTADRRGGGGVRRRAPGHRRGGRSAAPPRST